MTNQHFYFIKLPNYRSTPIVRWIVQKSDYCGIVLKFINNLIIY